MKTVPGYASDWYPAMRNLAGLFPSRSDSDQAWNFFALMLQKTA